MPLVSVVLPTYNRAQLLPDAIRSVLEQSFTDFELIVVDDDSTDSTRQVVAGINDPRIRYFCRPKNGGVAAARNTGIELSTGKYVAFQDSDDAWLPGKLQKQVEQLQALGGGAISVGRVTRQTGGAARDWPREPVQLSPGGVPPFLLTEPWGYVQALLVPRQLLVEVAGFDESLPMLEDWDLLLRLASKARFVYCRDAAVLSARQTDSLTENRMGNSAMHTAVMGKHQSLQRQAPVRWAALHYYAGRYALGSGLTAQARAHFLEAIKLNPLGARYYAFYLLGGRLLGKTRRP